MSRIPESSVDCIICDPPYGQTNCEWDTPIPLTEMWEQYGRVLVDIPKNLNNKQKELVLQFDSTTSEKNYAKRKNFFETLKKFFNE